MNRKIATSVVALTIAAQAPAHAQSADGAGAQDIAGIGDIVVTAQRRVQTLQNVAVPVTAVTGDQVQALNATQAEALTQLAPALNISQAAGAFTLFYLRGVGSFGGNNLSDSATAFNYDGVYVARASSTFGMYYDLDRVEVLKGPQGTLYGRNATGGAINIIPRRPRYGENEGEFTVDYGNYDALTLTGAVNIAAGDNGAFRIAGQWTDRDGYQSDGTSDAKGRALRFQAGVEPKEGFTIRLGFDFYHAGGAGAGGTVRFPNGRYIGGDANIGLTDPVATAYFNSLPRVPQDQRPIIFGTPFQDNRYWGVNAEIEYQSDIGTITVIPAYRRSETDFLTHVPGFTIDQGEKNEQRSLEMRLASDPGSGPLQYVVGGYYLHEQINVNGLLASQSVNGAIQTYRPRTESWAVFGQATYSLTDRLRATGGIRYTRDDKSAFIAQDNRPPQGLFGPDPSDFAFSVARKDSAVTWRGALEYDLGRRSLLYASAEKGYKAGGFTLVPAAPLYEDERIIAYTVGSKNKLFDNRVLLNVEAFLWDYKDQQYSHLGAVVLPGGAVIPGFVTDNVGDAKIKGVDVETQFLVTPDTLLGAQVQYLDAQYDSFSYRTPNLGPPNTRPNVGASCTNAYTPPVVGTTGVQTVNCAGAPLPFTSKWTISLAAQQTIHVGEGRIVANVGARYESGKYAGTEFLPAQFQPGIWTIDGGLSYTFPGDRITLAGYVRNATNKDVLAQTFVPFSSRAFVIATVRPPRTYGMRLTSKF